VFYVILVCLFEKGFSYHTAFLHVPALVTLYKCNIKIYLWLYYIENKVRYVINLTL